MADEALKHVLALQIWLKKNECAQPAAACPLFMKRGFKSFFVTFSGFFVALVVCSDSTSSLLWWQSIYGVIAGNRSQVVAGAFVWLRLTYK